MRLLLTLAFAWPALAQVQIRFSPEPSEVLRAMNVKKLGVWSVALCSDYPHAIIVPRERVVMAAGQIHIVDPVRATAVLNTRRATTKKAIAAEAIEYLLLGASLFGGSGMIAMTPKILGALAAGTGVAHTVQDRLRTQLPDLGPFTGGLLAEPIPLAPAACTTRTIFAGLMKNPQPVSAVIQIQ
jgi:hypothetical protein